MITKTSFIPYTEAEIQVVSPRLVQKHYTNAPRIAMVVQQSKIKCRTQVYRFCAHSLTKSIALKAPLHEPPCGTCKKDQAGIKVQDY